jgi:hypothetical protein
MLAAARRLTVEGTSVRVVQAMNAAGVRCLLLKGPSLADLYDGLRHYSDIDLLVASESTDAAEAALAELGFELRHDDPHSRIWRREGLDVDLHTTIVGTGVGADRLWDVLGGQTELISVGAASIEALNRPARALHVVLHAAQHGMQEAKPREDLRRALERLPDETWVDAARLAVELDAQAAFWIGLGMEPAGEELRESLELGRGTRRTETELRASTAPPTAVGLLRLAGTRGFRAKAGLVWREVFPSASFLRTWSSLARRGPGGLALAYLWRPVWMLLRLGPALGAIIRARRAAGR